MPRPVASRLRATTAAARPLPCDERGVAAGVLLRAGSALAASELKLCHRATRPGALPLDWRDKLRLSVIAGQHLGDAAP